MLAAAVPVLAEEVIISGTPEAELAIKQLRKAEHLDRLNAQSYTGTADSEARSAYYRKAQELDALIGKLQAGKSISEEDVQRALDNTAAERYIETY